MITLTSKFIATPHVGCALELPFKILSDFMSQEFKYASRGRWALYHCVKSLGSFKKALLPAYICKTVVEPLEALGLQLYFYDCEVPSCNPCMNSLEENLNAIKPDVVILASMYGNALDYNRAMNLCKKSGVVVIDDAAQSFGATYQQQPVGTFGDAGFISLSPAKPVCYALGAYYWTANSSYSPALSNRNLLHKLLYWEFVMTRVKKLPQPVSKVVGLVKVLYKLFDFKNHNVSKRELNDHSMEIYSLINSERNSNLRSVKKMKGMFPNDFSVLTAGQVESSPSKFVIYHRSKKRLDSLKKKLKQNDIYFQSGYESLSVDDAYRAHQIGASILEMPIAKSREDFMLLERALGSLHE